MVENSRYWPLYISAIGSADEVKMEHIEEKILEEMEVFPYLVVSGGDMEGKYHKDDFECVEADPDHTDADSLLMKVITEVGKKCVWIYEERPDDIIIYDFSAIRTEGRITVCTCLGDLVSLPFCSQYNVGTVVVPVLSDPEYRDITDDIGLAEAIDLWKKAKVRNI